jgi:hypothetical protein
MRNALADLVRRGGEIDSLPRAGQACALCDCAISDEAVPSCSAAILGFALQPNASKAPNLRRRR